MDGSSTNRRKMKERIYWIDNAKVMGIYLVILGHLRLASPFVTQVIYAFHIPLFFFLSGMLFSPATSRQVLVRKSFDRLMAPYFLINVFFLMMHMAVRAGKKLQKKSADNHSHLAYAVLRCIYYESTHNPFSNRLCDVSALFYIRNDAEKTFIGNREKT